MELLYSKTFIGKAFYCFAFCLFFHANAISQDQEQQLGCGTSAPTPEQVQFTLKEIATVELSNNAGTTCIALKPHIFRTDDGMEGISSEDLAIGLSYLNAFYLEAGLEFYYCGAPNYINNSDLYDFNEDAPDNDTEAALAAATTEAMDAVNVYFVNSIVLNGGFGACGYAYFPSNNPIYNRVIMTNSCTTNAPNGTYVHEFGHYFGLYHTHQGTSSGPNSPNAENVPRVGPQANCDTKGDLLCDTEADPKYDNMEFNFATCTYTGMGIDQFDNPYTPPVNNVMSYYPDACGGILTPQQYTRIQQGYMSRAGATLYSLDCTPPAITVPVGLAATFVTNKVDLVWTDAANNELGYLIERSTTSATAGFEALIGGGVGENVSTFSDNTINANNTYWYRVKPINGACNTYSNVAGPVTVGLFYCQASTTTCDEFISRVQMGTIDNISNCTAGGYHDYTAQSTTVDIGIGTALTVTNGPPTYNDDMCGVWVDWNGDGDFNDTHETIALTGNPGGGPYNATITPPAEAVAGATVMRIRIDYNTTPAACGNSDFGEVEDYSLVVNAPMSQTRIWTGAVNSDWTNAGNWSVSAVPTLLDDVIIPIGTPDTVLSAGQTGFCNTLDVETGAVLIVEQGAVCNVMQE